MIADSSLPIRARPPMRYFGRSAPSRSLSNGPRTRSCQLAEAFGAKRFHHGVPHAVEARVRQPAEVVRPRQHVEFEVIVFFQVCDQVATAGRHRCAAALRGCDRRPRHGSRRTRHRGCRRFPRARRTGLQGNHIPPPPEYAVVPPNWSLASTTMTDRPSRAAVYAPTSPPPDPATMTSVSSSQVVNVELSSDG